MFCTKLVFCYVIKQTINTTAYTIELWMLSGLLSTLALVSCLATSRIRPWLNSACCGVYHLLNICSRGPFPSNKVHTLSWGKFWWSQWTGSRTVKWSVSKQLPKRARIEKERQWKNFRNFLISGSKQCTTRVSEFSLTFTETFLVPLNFELGASNFCWMESAQTLQNLAPVLLSSKISNVHRGCQDLFRPTLLLSQPALQYVELESVSIIRRRKDYIFNLLVLYGSNVQLMPVDLCYCVVLLFFQKITGT